MKNFLQHRRDIIENFCNTYKKGAFKSIWGIDLLCNVKSEEFVWLDKQLLDYQTLSEEVCVSGCTVVNPSFLILDYPTCTGQTPFPQINCFNPLIGFSVPQPEQYSSGSCCAKVTVNNGSTIEIFNYTTVVSGSTLNVPINGNSMFIDVRLIGYNVQLALSGYGFYTPGTMFTFNPESGSIQLLVYNAGQLLFNTGEVYTIFAYK